MEFTYTFREILDLIDEAKQPEITALCAVISEEKSSFSKFQLRVIAAAINIQLDHLQLATG